MGITKAISSKANLKQQTTADLPINPFQIVSEMYGPVTTTTGQTVVNILPISVDTTNAINFLLIVDGKILTLGALNDYTFTNISPNGTSSQVTLTQPLAGGLNLFAIYLGVVQPSQSASSLSTLQAQVNSVPQVTILTSGSGFFTPPTGATYLTIEMIGGGGGGSGSGSPGGSTGGTGGDTTFGPMTANGGTGGVGSDAGVAGAGGAATLGVGPIGIAVPGAYGSGGSTNSTGSGFAGAPGAGSPFSGPTMGAQFNSGNGFSANPNTGCGGQGGAQPSVNGTGNGAGGGAGGYIKAMITSPSGTYAYSVGSGGSGGGPGGSGGSGGNGGSGIIIITAHFAG